MHRLNREDNNHTRWDTVFATGSICIFLDWTLNCPGCGGIVEKAEHMMCRCPKLAMERKGIAAEMMTSKKNWLKVFSATLKIQQELLKEVSKNGAEARVPIGKPLRQVIPTELRLERPEAGISGRESHMSQL